MMRTDVSNRNGPIVKRGCRPAGHANLEGNRRPPSERWWVKVCRWARLVYLRLVRQNGEPDKVAKALGLGVFLGIFPTFGVGTLVAVLIAGWVHWNRASAALGTFIMNPLLNPFFLSLSVVAGNLLVPEEFRIALGTFREAGIWSGFLHAVPTYLLGNLIVSTIFAVGAYWVSLGVVRRYRQRRQDRRGENGKPAAVQGV